MTSKIDHSTMLLNFMQKLIDGTIMYFVFAFLKILCL